MVSATPPPVRVAVDNDFSVVVRGLAAVLGEHPDRVDVVEVGAPEGADVVVRDSFAATEDLAEYVQRVPARVVLFTAADSEKAVRRALEQGVAGYVHKSVTLEGLVDALVRVGAGEHVVIRGARGQDSLRTVDWPGRPQGLSDREGEVVGLICQGLTNADIADRLYLSVNSIKTYIRTAYRKMGVDSRSQAVIWGVQNGFGTPGDLRALTQPGSTANHGRVQRPNVVSRPLSNAARVSSSTLPRAGL